MARRELAGAMEGWSQQGFHLQHYYHLHAATDVDLYCGDVEAAERRTTGSWPALKGSLLLRVQLIRCNATHVRARATLARAARERGGKRNELIASASRDAKRLAGEGMTWSSGLGELIAAGCANASGHADEAIRRLRIARKLLAQGTMGMHAAAAERRLGVAIGGDKGAEWISRAEGWMRGHAIGEPARMTQILAPGWE
jgi:hypothetical protein